MVVCQPSDLARFAPDKPGKVPLAEGAHARVNLWCLEPGQEIEPHAHAGDHVWSVLEGEGWYLHVDGAEPVARGSFIFAPAGEVHGMRAKTSLVFTSVSAG